MSDKKRRVMITGLGTVNSIGNNAKDTWEAAKAGKCGIAPITYFDTTDCTVTLAAEVKGLEIGDFFDKKEARHMDRFTQLSLIAADEAWKDSGFPEVLPEEEAQKAGCIFSSGIGGIQTIENEHGKYETRGFRMISPFFIPMAISNMSAGRIAIAHGLKDLCTCPVTACASSTNAIGDAFRHIRDGYGDIMVAGGGEAAITDISIGGFASMKALSTSSDPSRASIPFDGDRDGFVMGEGAGAVILEELEHALVRGAKIYAEVTGYGANCDAHHITSPLPDGSGAAECIRRAIQDASIEPDQVDYINAHGTSTKLNDAGETAAIKSVFGAHAKEIMISSTKAMTGHMLGAAGAVEAILTALALKDGAVPATINYKNPDPDCDLDYVTEGMRKADIKTALSESFGFGGHNAVIAMRKYEV